MNSESNGYIALLTHDKSNVQYHKEVDGGDLFAAAIGASTSGNLSAPKQYPLTLGFYTLEPCDAGALLTQMESGERVAWRIFSDERFISDIIRSYMKTHNGSRMSSITTCNSSGDVGRADFPLSSLDGLLSDDLFSIPPEN